MENLTIRVNNLLLNCKKGETLLATLKEKGLLDPESIVVLRNGKYSSYQVIPEDNDEFTIVTEYNSIARRVYENTAAIILYHVAKKLFPKRELIIAHSMSNGLFCKFNVNPLDLQQDISSLEKAFLQAAKSNLPIKPRTLSRDRAVKYFTSKGRRDTANLLKYLNNNYVELYEIEGSLYWAQTPLAPSTGYLTLFELKPYKNGFILRYPIEGNRKRIPAFSPQDKLFEIFSEFETWGEILNLAEVSQINHAIKSGEIDEIIKLSEALHERKIVFIAEEINRIDGKRKVVFISGPSSSGKTTFMKRLYIQLKVLGHRIITISLDDYYKDREELYREQGPDPDFERLEALDTNLLQTQIKDLIAQKPVRLPKFDFKAGKKIFSNEVVADNNCVILIEGIHALNPRITRLVENNPIYKIYISALTHLNFDNANRIPTHDLRLLRRIVRDRKFRSHNAEETINNWKKVVNGENKYIFPFQEEADIMFNSSLVFEFGVLKKYAVKYLGEVPESSPAFPDAARLKEFLKYFLTIPDRPVPSNSILREFIGGSSFKY